MFKNYFKIALRNLIKNKVYSAINILGLSVGIACCILIFLFVRHELSYDTFHKSADTIYIVAEEGETAKEYKFYTQSPALCCKPIFQKLYLLLGLMAYGMKLIG